MKILCGKIRFCLEIFFQTYHSYVMPMKFSKSTSVTKCSVDEQNREVVDLWNIFIMDSKWKISVMKEIDRFGGVIDLWRGSIWEVLLFCLIYSISSNCLYRRVSKGMRTHLLWQSDIINEVTLLFSFYQRTSPVLLLALPL